MLCAGWEQTRLRFLRPKKSKSKAKDLQFTCHLGGGGASVEDEDDNASDSGTDAGDIIMSGENLQDDMDLVQEMEMDRFTWSKQLDS